MKDRTKKNTNYLIKLIPVIVVFLLLVLIYSLTSNHFGLPSMSNLFIH